MDNKWHFCQQSSFSTPRCSICPATSTLDYGPSFERIQLPKIATINALASRLWRSQFASPTELPQGLRELFERTGYGCLAVDTSIGAVHICHASDTDIEGFSNRPVLSQWQLIKMPTAPLILLDLLVVDDLMNPYKFESFLNVAEKDQAQVLHQLVRQDELHLAFYGDDLSHRYTKTIQHHSQQRYQLRMIVREALRYWNELPPQQRDFDRAKAEFMRRFI